MLNRGSLELDKIFPLETNDLDVILPISERRFQFERHPKLIAILPIEPDFPWYDEKIDLERQALVEVEIVCADCNAENDHIKVDGKRTWDYPSFELFASKLVD